MASSIALIVCVFSVIGAFVWALLAEVNKNQKRNRRFSRKRRQQAKVASRQNLKKINECQAPQAQVDSWDTSESYNWIAVLITVGFLVLASQSHYGYWGLAPVIYSISAAATSPGSKSQQHRQAEYDPYKPPFQNDSADVDMLKRKLLNLVNGHHPTAQRLLNECQRQHPGMSADWYLDKVIYDLIRDRR